MQSNDFPYVAGDPIKPLPVQPEGIFKIYTNVYWNKPIYSAWKYMKSKS